MHSSPSKLVESIGGKRYTLIVRDGFSRHTWVDCMRHQSYAVELSEPFLVDTRADGVPSQVVIVPSDGAVEFHGGEFGNLCRSGGIKQQ